MSKVLVVEDDLGIQKQLKWGLSDYKLVFASTRSEAIAAARRFEPAVITLDLGLPPDPDNATEGLKTLQELLSLLPHSKVIVITGNDDKAIALQCIEHGAHDFYEKPIDIDILKVMISRAMKVAQLEVENERLKENSLDEHGFIGVSPKVAEIRRMVEKIANTEIRTLILGESGTGKEVIARAIHQRGERVDKPFVAINCASIPENLLESELFGFEKGAFTGAHKTTIGKIEQANGGTLFLDEIGDMPFGLQAKLLRFLQESVIERIGGRREITVDVKVICATHQDLTQMMQEKRFRDDLYYRVSEIVIHSPALREREEDVILLAKFFLDQYIGDKKTKIQGFTEDALQSLLAYPWPGNIRELQNKIKSALIMCDGKQLTESDLMMPSAEQEVSINLRKIREEAEKSAISKALVLSEGNVTHTAQLLGVARPTLYSLMEKYELSAQLES
ncbi:PEP-CTERM-box response regulator transcription factor [Vibrio ulleungensis]|uniref:PEP-CTERM-box response regulator transcription factor n=1 Tax=Vibrio ulleungensis TaxID=2807619 RepID=A0ABS2HHJ0_9VIBR|nr:PEP-CTERM-box response regulator transcription factor [Vibrio ulleungensis]MBM7037003.1 PEP-CTERM-box response regulator transcription factor [Vibrio ulleungensis]